MSQWLEIVDIEDLEIDVDNLNVLYDCDIYGNKYITIPISLITKLIEASKAKPNPLDVAIRKQQP